MMTQPPPHRIIRFKDVSQRTGLKHTWIYEQIKAGKFPPPIILGERARGWIESEIDAWITARVQASRGVVSAQTIAPQTQEVVP